LARAAKQPAKNRDAWVKEYHLHQADAIKENQTADQFAEEMRIVPVAKLGIERRVEIVLRPPAAKPVPPNPPAAPKKALPVKDNAALLKALAEDTRLNEGTRRRQIHTLLADKGLVRPEKVTRPIYKDVLHADLDDPYLGLGKTLFATYPFAAEDGKAKP